MFGCILFLIIHDFSLTIQLERHLNNNRQPQHQESMLSAALGFLKNKRATDHYSVFRPKAVEFSDGCCHHELNESTGQMDELSFISL